jgi:hypothetical protein
MSPFLVGVTLLLLFQCIGGAVARLASLPVPGPRARHDRVARCGLHGVLAAVPLPLAWQPLRPYLGL